MRSIQVAQAVPKLELCMKDGTKYIWEMSLFTARIMAEEDDGTFTCLEEMKQRYNADPAKTLTDMLYYGMRANHPDITREDIERMIPPSAEVMIAIAEELLEAATEGMTENPQTPGAEAQALTMARTMTENG